MERDKAQKADGAPEKILEGLARNLRQSFRKDMDFYFFMFMRVFAFIMGSECFVLGLALLWRD